MGLVSVLVPVGVRRAGRAGSGFIFLRKYRTLGRLRLYGRNRMRLFMLVLFTHYFSFYGQVKRYVNKTTTTAIKNKRPLRSTGTLR
jgi:hypothetical protein